MAAPLRPCRRRISPAKARQSAGVHTAWMRGSAASSSCFRCRSSADVSSATCAARLRAGLAKAASTAPSSGSIWACSASISSSRARLEGRPAASWRTRGHRSLSSTLWCSSSWALKFSQPARAPGASAVPAADAAVKRPRSRRKASWVAYIMVKSIAAAARSAVSLAVTVLTSWSICDSDGPVDRFGLLEHAEHEVGDVGAGDEQAAAEVLAERRPIAPGEEAGENGVGSGDRRFERCRVRAGQVGGDRMYLPGQLAGVSYDSGDVVVCGDGLLQELPANASGRCEDRELHLSSRCLPGLLLSVLRACRPPPPRE